MPRNAANGLHAAFDNPLHDTPDPGPHARSPLTTFTGAGVRSLAWEGDVLVDWVSGGTRWTLQGERSDSCLLLGFSFDMAQSLPGSGYSVIYKRLGTKGVVFKDGRVLREIDATSRERASRSRTRTRSRYCSSRSDPA